MGKHLTTTTQPKTTVHDQDKIIFCVFWVEYLVVTYRMHSEAEICWLNMQNAFRSRIFIVMHTYRSESSSAHKICEME